MIPLEVYAITMALTEAPKAIFIAYADRDRRLANSLCNLLQKNGFGCWFAANDITGGTEFVRWMGEKISQSRLLLLLLSRNSFESRHVKGEFHAAYDRGLAILPVYAGITKSDLPAEFEVLRGIHSIEVKGENLEPFADEILRAVRALLERNGNGSSPNGNGPRFSPWRWARLLRRRAILVGLAVACLVVVVLSLPNGPPGVPPPHPAPGYEFVDRSMIWRPYPKYEGPRVLPNAADRPDWIISELGKDVLRIPVRFNSDRTYAAVAANLHEKNRRAWNLSKGMFTVRLSFEGAWPYLQDEDPGVRVFLRDENNRSQWGCWYDVRAGTLGGPVTFEVPVSAYRELRRWLRLWICDGFQRDRYFSDERVWYIGVSVESNRARWIDHEGTYLLHSLRWERPR
jgi:hypothetical protein